MNFVQILLTGLIGLISGAIGSLIAPWVKWGIEKRKMRFEYRIKVIDDIRALVKIEPFDRVKIINSSSYKIIKEDLSKSTIDELERPINQIKVYVGHHPIDPERNAILEDIVRLQKKWKIV
jgi:hypothetical protein